MGQLAGGKSQHSFISLFVFGLFIICPDFPPEKNAMELVCPRANAWHGGLDLGNNLACWRAAEAASESTNLTKPNPLDLPVWKSRITFALSCPRKRVVGWIGCENPACRRRKETSFSVPALERKKRKYSVAIFVLHRNSAGIKRSVGRFLLKIETSRSPNWFRMATFLKL